MRPTVSFEKGLHCVAPATYAYLQPYGQWGYSNAGLVVGNEVCLLVDTLFSLELTAEMLATMRAVVSQSDQIDWLVNTHANGDHCYGNQLVPEAEIISSVGTAEDVAHDDPQLLQSTLAAAKQLGELGEYFTSCFGEFNFDGIVPTPPTKTFQGELILDVGGREVQLLELGPAHTSGDVAAFVVDERVLYSGDLLFIGGTPIVWAGPISHWITACDQMIALEPRIVVPGHGPLTDISGISQVREYLCFVLEQAREMFERGVLPTAAANEIVLGEYSRWLDAERLAVNVAMAYHEIAPAEWPVVTAIEAFRAMAGSVHRAR